MGDHDGEFSIAGYNIIGGDWHNVESGGGTPFESTGFDVGDLDRATFHYTSPAGDDVYFTVHGPWDDWESFVDYLEYIMDGYGVA